MTVIPCYRRVVCLALIALFAHIPPVSVLAAQDSTMAPRPRLCFRGRAKPACDRFFLTEVGVYHPMVSSTVTYDGFGGVTPYPTYRYPDVGRQLTFQLGAMVNRGTKVSDRRRRDVWWWSGRSGLRDRGAIPSLAHA